MSHDPGYLARYTVNGDHAAEENGVAESIHFYRDHRMYTSCHAFVMRCNPCVVEDGIADCRLKSSEGCVRNTPWPTNVRDILVRDCNVAIQPPETIKFARSFGGDNHGESCHSK